MTLPETASSDTGITFSAAAASIEGSNSLLLLKPPPGSEIPRSASVSSALPRPRPQVDLQIENYEIKLIFQDTQLVCQYNKT